ncbi:MAG: MBL fold metallo-hydrolase [Gammaproteobacteria bacterium]|jgi:glyoxylase-like metal-dependent hydrolase (beta-lactamase superfamily II)
MKIRQLFDSETSTFTYLVWDEKTREAALIDSVDTRIERDLQLIRELNLDLKYTLETHIHADHITASGQIRDRLGSRAVVHRNSQSACADILVTDGDTISLGDQQIVVMETPGHTDTCITYRIDGIVFTGDALLIRGCGRTDFQAGDPGRLYDSIHDKLFSLPDETIVYPAHDYNGFSSSTIGEEKAHNPRLGNNRPKQAFVDLMNALDLDPPGKIAEAVPGNLECGLKQG